MKLIISIIVLVSHLNASAAFKTTTKVHLVFADYNAEGLYSIQSYPLLGCYGLKQGPQTQQFTEEFTITAERGCGLPATSENVNALSCASATYEWTKGILLGVKRAIIDISKCEVEAQDLMYFKEIIVKAAKMNFGDHIQVIVQ